jgi:hypothetical protein
MYDYHTVLNLPRKISDRFCSSESEADSGDIHSIPHKGEAPEGYELDAKDCHNIQAA